MKALRSLSAEDQQTSDSARELRHRREMRSLEFSQSRTSMTAVLYAVAELFGVPVDSVLGVSRVRHVANARHACCWVLAHECGVTYTRIAELMSRDHSTVIYGYHKMVRALQNSPESFRHKLSEIGERARAGTLATAPAIDDEMLRD